MRAIFNIAFLTLMLAPALAAQTTVEPPSLARLRFVNATGMPGAVQVALNGARLNSRGYTTGQATGHLDVEPKTTQVLLKHDELGENQLTLNLSPGETKAIIALAKIAPPKKEGEKPDITLIHHVLDFATTDEGQESSLTVLQTTPLPSLELDIAGKSCTAERMKPSSLPVTGSMGKFPIVQFQQKRVCSLSYHEPADAALILYADASGNLQHIFFKNDIR